MQSFLKRLGHAGTGSLRRRIITLFALLLIANAMTWMWAWQELRHFPLLLGTALLAYGFGLRHAVDADHIAAIDNVTRKLMQEGQRPVGVGFFFSLGHSTVVILASAAIALTAAAFTNQLQSLQVLGGVVGTLISAAFLLLIAAINMAILATVARTFREVRRNGVYLSDDLDLLFARGGLLARIFRPLFRMISRSWHMFPLGLLFGLGFDTATEIGLLGISAAEAAKGLPIWSILVFPALFTAGMTLVDTADSVLMIGAYGWAFVKPIRKLYYNMTITAVSVLVALLVGGIEVLGLIGSQLNLTGGFWNAISGLNGKFGAIGYVIIGVFAASWVVSLIVYRLRGYDALEVSVEPEPQR
jgi:nickel/cobalt transporter (NiCoT) family protein